MATDNRYSPPAAAVADVIDSDEIQPIKIWAATGRIGRLRYLAYTTTATLVMMLGVGILSAIFGAKAAGALTVVGYIALIVFGFLQLIKRGHDFSWSGWMGLLSLIPFVGLIWLFKSGTAGSNDYGAPPPPNTTGVKVLAFVLPFVFIIGILAAIAIPAYQQYMSRAGG
jgi:uncharacterized membrane protein YhaH (DUF805 family)